MPPDLGACLRRLNDLHRASGGHPSHRPGEWVRNKQTQALIAEITDAEISASVPVEATKGGIGEQGTYVAKELVYAYAKWISPVFHLKVIRAYDALHAPSADGVDRKRGGAEIPAPLLESGRPSRMELALAAAAPRT